MGLSPFKGRPAGDHEVIMGPSNEKVNASSDRSRNVPPPPYVPSDGSSNGK